MTNKVFGKIWLYDNVIIGNNHLSINTGIFDIAQHLCNDSRAGSVTFYGDKYHLEVIKKQVDQVKNIQRKFIPIQVTHPRSGRIAKLFSWAQKLKKDRKEFKKMMKQADFEKPGLIILNTLIPFNFKFFLESISHHPYHKFMFILHGEVEHYFSNETSLKGRLYRRHYNYLFRKAPGNLKIATLNHFTKRQIVREGKMSEDRIIHIPHPLPSKEIGPKQAPQFEPLSILFLGVANQRKGAHHLNNLASTINQQKVSLYVLGRSEIPMSHGVHVISEDNKPIPQDKYELEIRKAHYALSFLTEPEYLHRVSGSLLDAVIYQLPLLALDHPAIRELFEQGGNIGYIFGSVDEMAKKISEISDHPDNYMQEYFLQRKNLCSLKKKFIPAAIAQKLKNALL